MMFSFVPAWKVPTVTTAMSRGSTVRDTTVCSRVTTCAPSTTGSMECCGCEPWACRPCRVTRHESAIAMAVPTGSETVPASEGMTCWP